jgi:hypothetical protein
MLERQRSARDSCLRMVLVGQPKVLGVVEVKKVDTSTSKAENYNKVIVEDVNRKEKGKRQCPAGHT